MAPSITVDIQRLEKVYEVNLHEFENGNAHSFSKHYEGAKICRWYAKTQTVGKY